MPTRQGGARQRQRAVPNPQPYNPTTIDIGNTVPVTGSVTASITGSVTVSGTVTVSGIASTVTVSGTINFASLYPATATPTVSASGNVANATASATLNGVAAKTTYLSGFEVTGAGATLGLPVVVTVTGPTVTLSYVYSAIAGVLQANAPLIVAFSPPVPAGSVSTAITVSCPPLGSGNTNNAVVARGFQL